jgi:hypothetical protein
LDGKHEYDPDEYPSDEFRTWRLCTMLHCRPSELDDESAAKLDWLLAVDDTIAKYRKQKEEEAWSKNG